MTCSIVQADPLWFSSKDDLQSYQSVYEKFGYTSQNTRIWKSTNNGNRIKFDWEEELISQIPLDHAVVTLTRQDPGQILPWHRDRFFMLRNLYPDDKREIVRVLMFMQDWKLGHLLQIHRDVYTHWQQGEMIMWPSDTYHLSANVGFDPKWTCNITGFVNDQSFYQTLKNFDINSKLK